MKAFGADRSVFIPGIVFFLVAVSTLYGINMMPETSTFHDESFHTPQIMAYQKGHYLHLEKSLTMIPGYHLVVAWLSAGIFGDGIDAVRLASFLFSLPAVVFFYLCAAKLNKPFPLLSTSVFYLCPIFFPFFFVIYTDVPSLSFILGGLYATLCRRYYIAGSILIAAMFIRQTNVIWLFFCWGLCIFQELDGVTIAGNLRNVFRKEVKSLAQKSCLFAIGILVFLTFIILNEGVALGDTQSHGIDRLYITQVFFWLLAVFLVLLPLHLANAKKVYLMLRSSPEWLLMGSILFALFYMTFWAEHGYNNMEFFLRNRIILWIKESDWHKVIVFLPMLYCFYSLLVSPMISKKFYFLYPIMVTSIIPHALVDQRYFMASIAMLMLFLKIENRNVHILLLAFYLPVLCMLYLGISKIQFFI